MKGNVEGPKIHYAFLDSPKSENKLMFVPKYIILSWFPSFGPNPKKLWFSINVSQIHKIFF